MPEKIVSPKVTKETLSRFERGIKNDPNATDAELLSMYPEFNSEEGLQDAFRYINNKKLGKSEDELTGMFGDAFPMLKKKVSSDSGKPITTQNTGEEKSSESKSTSQSTGSAEPNWATDLSQVKKPDVRPDGTKKGMGFLGPLPTKDGKIATEMSIGVEIDGKETLIPTLIPTLTKEEKDWILAGGDPSQKGDPIADAIAGKAIDHAKDRISKGQSPFAGIKTKEWSTEPVQNPFAIPRNPTSEESKRLIEMGAQTSKDRELYPDSNDIDAILGNPNISTTTADFKQFINPADRSNPAKRFGNERYTSEEMAGKVKRSDASIAYFMELEKKREKQIEGLSEKYQKFASAKKAEVESSVENYKNKINAAYKDKVQQFVASLPKPKSQEEAVELQKQAEAFNKKIFEESSALITDFAGKKNEELKSYVETNLASEMSKEAQKGGIYYSDEDKRRVANIFSSQKFQDLPFVDQKALVGGVWYRERLKLLKQGKTPAEIADAKDYFYHTALGNAISNKSGKTQLSPFAIRSWAEDMSADLDKRIAEQKKLLPSENLGLDQQQYVEEMKDLQSLLQAKKNIDQVKSMPDNDLGSWASGLSDANKIPLASAVVGLSEAVKLGQVASKTTRTAADDLLLMSKGMIDDLEANANPSMAYRIGKQTGEMLPYIGEFILTGGAFTASKAATQKVLTETLTKKFGTWATKSVVQRSLVRPMGTLVGALAQTAVNPQMYIKNTVERMNPIFEFSMSEDAQSVLGKVDASTKIDAQGYSIGKNEDAFTAAMRGFGMAYSEMFTERLGESLLSPALKAVSKSITPEFAKRMTLATWLTKRGLTPEQGVSEILLKQMGWDGIISEMGEELINIPLTNIITDRPLAEGASGEELKVLAGSVVSMAMLTGGISLVGKMATSPVELKYRDNNGEEKSIQLNRNLAKAIQYMASRTAPTEKGAVSLDYFDIQEFKDKVFGNVKMNKEDREVVLGLINAIQDRLSPQQKPGLQTTSKPDQGFQDAVYAEEEPVSDMLLLGPIDQEEADVYEVQAENVPEPNIRQEALDLEVQLADQSLSDIERASLEQRKAELGKILQENAKQAMNAAGSDEEKIKNEWTPKKNDLAVNLMKQYNSMTPAKRNSKKGVQLMSRISSFAGNFGLDISEDKDGKIQISKDGSKLKATPIKSDIETPDQYDIDYAKSMLERGVVLPDVDFGITPAEAEKGMQDILKGNMTNPAKVVVAGLKKSREFGGYDVIERDDNNRPTGNKYFVSFEDIEAELNEPILIEPDQEEKLAAEFDIRMSELTDEQLEQIYLLSIDEEQQTTDNEGEAPVVATKEKSTTTTGDEKGGGEGKGQEVDKPTEVALDTKGDDVVYRGIDKRGFAGEGGGIAGLGKGLYTTNSLEEAKKYAWEDGRTKGVPKAFINAKPQNPLVLKQSEVNDWFALNLPKSKYKTESELRDNLAVYLTDLGYDGVTIKSEDGVESYVKYKKEPSDSKIKEYQQKEDKAKSVGDESMSDNYVQVASENDFLIEHIERYYGKDMSKLTQKELSDAEKYTKDNYKGEGYYNDTMDDFIGNYEQALTSFWEQTPEVKEQGLDNKKLLPLNDLEKKEALENGIPEEEAISTRNYFKKPYQEEKIPSTSKVLDFLEDYSNAKEMNVSIDDITPTQRTVESLAENNQDNRLPILLKNGNDIFVMDGHHRISKLVLSGKKEVKAKVFDITGLEVGAPKKPDNKEQKKEVKEQDNKELLDFTEAKDINRIFTETKEKYGEKQGAKYNEAANRLVNPNKNTIIQVRSNGVVVKKGDKYLLLPFTNTDANYKKWELADRPLDVTDQFEIVPLTNEVNNAEVVEPQDQKWSGKSPAKEQKEEIKEQIEVKKFGYGDGGTKGVFVDNKGNLYKSTQPQSIQQTEKGFERKPIEGKTTDEYEILLELQGNPSIPKVGKLVETSEGPAFEIEKLDEIQKYTPEEYQEISNILDDLNNKGYHVGDKVSVMRRPKTNELVVIDFSSGYKGDRMSRDSKDYMMGIESKMSKSDLAIVRYNNAINYAVDYFKKYGKVSQFNEPKIKGFRYKMKMRPFGIGTYPKDGFVKMVSEGNKKTDGYHAIIEYSKPLSEKDIESFELEYEGQNGSVYDLTDEVNKLIKQEEAKPIKEQIESFGVAPDMVAPVETLLDKMFQNQKEAGLTTANTLEEWLSIGRGEEKPFSLKIDGKDVEVKSILPEVVNGFYSNTEKALSEVKQDKMTGAKWSAQLLSRGANKEEMTWTGLDSFLKENAAKTISKSDIQQHLKDNRIEIVEVVKGETQEAKIKEYQQNAIKKAEKAGLEIDFGSENEIEISIPNEGVLSYDEVSAKGNIAFSARQYNVDASVLETAKELFDENKKIAFDNAPKAETKFKDYQLEGEKENYKEILVLSPYDSNYGAKAASAYNEYNQELNKKYGDGFMDKLSDTESKKLLDLSKRTVTKNPSASFKSTHFDEPNILVHLRMNTRTDSQGNKVLFLEEVQSDWGQEGKKSGFKKGLTSVKFKKEDFYAKRVEGNPNFIDVIAKRTNTRFESYHVSDVKNEDGALDFFIKQKEGLEYQEDASERTAIEPAPFVTDTNAWTKLGLKVALKEAVKQGADKIAWTTGEQQNDRYDLSKSVDYIVKHNENSINKEDNSIDVTISVSNGLMGIVVDKATGKIKSQNGSSQFGDFKDKRLEEVIGKDVADRILKLDDTEHKLQGNDLKVGGKGMKGFYGSPTERAKAPELKVEKVGDKFKVGTKEFKNENEAKKYIEEYGLGIVGNVAKSLFKQEPKTVEINTSKSGDSNQKRWVILLDGDIYEKQFNTKEEAEAFVDTNSFQRDAIGYEYKIKENLDLEVSTQNSIDITPELKKQAEEGQPLFKDSQAQFRIEAGKNIIEAIENFDGSPKAVVALTHEVMHPTIAEIIDGAKNGNEIGLKHANTIVSEYNKANPDSKITLEQLIEYNDKFKEGKTTDAYRNAQEFMADSWETYFKEGAKGFSKAFQEVLDQITAAFRAVYKVISGKELSPELRAMFDEILGKKPAQKPTLSELKENVKQAKQEVTRTQNALTKAKSNLERAGAEAQLDIYGNAKQNEMLFAPDIKALNQKVEIAKSELVEAKRKQVKAEDALNAYVPENQLQIKDDNRNTESGIEPNQPELPTQNADLPAIVQPADRGTDSGLDNENDGGVRGEGVQRLSDLPGNQSLSTDSGKRSPNSIFNGEPSVEPGDSTSPGSKQSGIFGASGVSPKSEPRTGDAKFSSLDGGKGQFEDKLAAQKAVNNTPSSEIKLGDIKNIAKTLPYLFDGQVEDIWKAENRLLVDGKKGILFGNQTGTGKTFVFIGTIKRMKLANPDSNILVITPKGPLKQTIGAAKVFDLDIKEAKSTKDSEGDMVITTYQNWYQNPGLKARNWDLVIFDESQNLMENQKGVEKAYIEALRETVATPDQSFLKAAQQIVGIRPEYDPADNSLLESWNKNVEQNKEAIQKRADGLTRNTKVMLASATPFTHEFSLAYADGILFQIKQGVKSEGGNAYDARDLFYISNFGYRIRYGRLTEPDAKVNKDLMLQVFADKLMAKGAMSTRLMNVDFDYSREFVLVQSRIGEVMDKGISILQEQYKFPTSDAFGYQYLSPLLEAMKAKEMIPRIQAHINMGRKVVVFHGYNNPIPTHPFGERLKEFAKTDEQYNALVKFWKENPEFRDLDVGLQNPIDTFREAFGNEAMFYNGKVDDKIKEANKNEFNSSGGRSLLIVNMAAGGAGLSLHDTTGEYPRAMINLGLPVRPVFLIQIEGRTYRSGQASNAIFEYPIINLRFERIIFGTKIAERANATELLVLGSRARNLREVFRDGYINAGFSEPNEGQGVGGKENDARILEVSQWDLAKSMYFGQKKGRQNDLGKDYFATPEPIGLKMVQFADLREGDKMLEPSAGHGAIARFAPEGIELHVIEPSSELRSRLIINISPDRVEGMSFEDFNIINKYDAIVMNPPFGTAGKTAVEHLGKAFKHLNDGGRVVAIIPNGQGQTRLKKWFESEEAANAVMVAEISMPNVMFERAGTSVSTSIYIIDKINNEIVRENLPSTRFINLSGNTTTSELFDAMEDLTVPARHAVEKFVAEKPLDSLFIMTTYKDSKGKDWNIAKPKERIGDELFPKVALIAKNNNGFYLRNSKGFAFSSEEDRGSFVLDSEKFLAEKEPERDIDSQIKDAANDLNDFMRNSRSELYANPMGVFVFGAKLAKLMALKIIKGVKTLADAIGELGITFTPWVRSMWEHAKEIAAKYWAQPSNLTTSRTQFWPGTTANPLFMGVVGRAFDGSVSMHQILFNLRTEIASMDAFIQNNPTGTLKDKIQDTKQVVQDLMTAVYGMTHTEAMNFVDDLRRDRLPATILYDYAWTEKEKFITHYGFGQRPIETLVKNIRKAGGIVTENQDPIIGLDLLPGRIGAISKDFEHKVISSQKGPLGKPVFGPSLIERMVADGLDLGDINGEVTVDENGQQVPGFYLRFTLGYSPVPSFPEYLHALHAKERNDEVAKRRQELYDARKAELEQMIADGVDVAKNQEYLFGLEAGLDPNYVLMPDGGSGMTNKEAEDIIHDLRVSHPEVLAKYDKYAKEFKEEVVEPLQKILTETEMLSEDGINDLNDKYSNWVHLAVDFYSDITSSASRPTAKATSAVKRVKGSLDRRLNPLLGTIAFFTANLLPAEINRARLQMYSLAKKFPNENLIKLHSPVARTYYDPIDGKIKAEIKQQPNNSIPVYKKGRIHYIQFIGSAGQKIYQAWENLNAPADPALHLRVLRSLNSWLFYVNIKFNPTFLFSNLTKDAANAAFNAASLQGLKINKAVVSAKALAYITPAIRAVFGASRGKQAQTSDTFLDYANRFLKQGGAVSMSSALAGGTMQAKIDKIISLIDEKGSVELAKDALSYYTSILSDAQNAVENGVRLAVFSSLVESGISDQQAAAIAKNITVNFDRIGSKAAEINMMIWMFKVSMSGILNIAKFARTPVGMGIASALFGAGLTLALYNMAKCENMWKAVPQGVKATKAVFLLNCDDLIQPGVPMAHGWSMFFYLGQLTAELSQGAIDKGEAAKEGIFAILNNINPLGTSSDYQSFASNFTPTIVDKVAEFATNRTWFSSPIAPEPAKYGLAQKVKDSENYWSSASEESIATAKFLSTLTGGDLKNEGAIDVSPSTLEYAYKSITGGTGRDIAGMNQLYKDLTQGNKLDLSKYPFTRGFTVKISEQNIMTEMYKMYDKYQTNPITDKQIDKFNELYQIRVMQIVKTSKSIEEFEKSSDRLEMLRNAWRKIVLKESLNKSFKVVPNMTTGNLNLLTKELAKQLPK